MEKPQRSTAEKIRLFRSLFTGLTHVYGTYDVKTGRVRQVKEPVTDKVIHAHLAGRQSYGVYLLTGDQTQALAVDFDEKELSLPMSFVVEARKYDISAYIERSKSKGHHVWIFFEGHGVPAYQARLVAQKILTDMGRPATEVFPKQDALADGVPYGNFIHAPLFGALVPKGRTVFVDPADPTAVYPDQWQLLAGVRRVPESRLDAVIKQCQLEPINSAAEAPESNNRRESNDETSPFGLPPCARRMLAAGVTQFQRVSCFRLAVHLKRNGMPHDLVLVTLKAWAQKNRPVDGKRIITEPEIQYQVKCAFANPYRSFGCEHAAIAAYCHPECPLYSYTVGRLRAGDGPSGGDTSDNGH